MKVTYLLTWVNEKETGAGKAYVCIIPANEIAY